MKTDNTKFIFLGNNLAIDFVNTQKRKSGELVDLLEAPADVKHWAQQVGFSLAGDVNPNDLAIVKALREELKNVFLAIINGEKLAQDELVTVNRYLEKHGTHQQLDIDAGTGGLRLIANHNTKFLSSLLANVAYEGAQLLTSSQVSNIKSCNNPECVLLFLDISRTRRRRWCSMDICGNRAKVARHYRKETQ